MINDIETKQKKSIEAIAKAYNTTECSLLASDIRINSKSEKYYTISRAGVCTPFAYQSTEIAAAFMGLICRIAQAGADLDYQPQMRIGESLKGCKVLAYTASNSLFKPTGNVICRELPTDTATEEMQAYKPIYTIGEQAEQAGAKIVLIEDAAALVGDSPQQALALLNSLAQAQRIMIIAGFMISEESEAVNNHLFNYCHNLIKLVESSIEMVTEDEGQSVKRFFCIVYGQPTSQFLFYGINEDGETYIIPKLAPIYLIIVFARMFAAKPVNKTIFLNNVFGALEGQFNKQTITNWIGLAVEAGILCQSGNAGKSTICLAGEDSKKKPKPAFSGNIALTALGNPYSDSTKHTKKRKPLCRIGEFKLLAPALGCSVIPIKNLTTEFIKMVATGKPALDFAVKTPHRNCLVIMLAEPKAGELMQSKCGSIAKGANFNVECISDAITDAELLRIYREKINSLQPDFCFILNLDKVVLDLYTPAQLAKEFALTSKRTGVATIAQTANDKAETLFEFEGSEYWCVKPLIQEVVMRDICSYHDGIELPHLYSFEGTEGKFEFLCRFRNTSPSLTLATAKEQKRAFLIGTFYWCKRTPCSDIAADCTGKRLTNSVIYQAQKEGIIDVEYTSGKKAYKESLITFVGY